MADCGPTPTWPGVRTPKATAPTPPHLGSKVYGGCDESCGWSRQTAVRNWSNHRTSSTPAWPLTQEWAKSLRRAEKRAFAEMTTPSQELVQWSSHFSKVMFAPGCRSIPPAHLGHGVNVGAPRVVVGSSSPVSMRVQGAIRTPSPRIAFQP